MFNLKAIMHCIVWNKYRKTISSYMDLDHKGSLFQLKLSAFGNYTDYMHQVGQSGK